MVGVDSETWGVENDSWMERCELPRFPAKDRCAGLGDPWRRMEPCLVFVGVVTIDPLHPFTGEDIGAMGRKFDLIPILRMMGGDPQMAWMR